MNAPKIVVTAAWMALTLASCGSIELKEREYRQILVVDKHGDSYELEVKGEQRKSLRRHVDEVLAAAEGERDIVLYFHGGMVSASRGASESKRIIAKARQDDVHVIAVNWETGFYRSYADYLFRIRSGNPAGFFELVFTVPFTLVADLGRAVSRLGLTYGYQGWANLKYRFGLAPVLSDAAWSDVASLDREGEHQSSLANGDLVLSIVPGAVRLVTTPLLDASGNGAYRNMRRRARVLFTRERDFDPRSLESEPTGRTGAVELLMQGLTRRWEQEYTGEDPQTREARQALETLRGRKASFEAVCQQFPTHAPGAPQNLRAHAAFDPDCPTCRAVAEAQAELADAVLEFERTAPLRITLIAHSMGAHVLNDILRAFPDLYYPEIVLMAPACSIQDFADSTLAFLVKHSETSCHLLTLHPLDDLDDAYGWYTLPRGSLLEWIDAYVSDLDSPLDYTLGKWNNVLGALPVLADRVREVQGRFFIKGFGRTGRKTPHDHGDFNDGRFWRESFWN